MAFRSKGVFALCLVLLLAALAADLLFSGISDMYFLNRVVLNRTPSMADIGFFTRQHVRREAVSLSASKLPEDSSLPSFRIYSAEQSLASLNENPPESGKKQYRQAHLSIDVPEFSSQIKFRYRGNIPLHWLNAKKSLRIRLPDFSNYRGLQRFNLVNPATMETITDWLSYDMSREIGLLTPAYFPARVFLNDEYNGLHFFLGQADESLLRTSGRVPGNIYAGDNFSLENPFGTELGINIRVFVDDASQSLMWTDYRLWEKSAQRNAEPGADHRDIEKFVSIVNQDDPLRFMREFNRYFDAEKYFDFWSLDTVVGSYHHDLYHNQKMYFDPYRGKFEPVQWDLRFWSSMERLPLTPLLRQIKLNPVLSYRLDQSTFRLLQKFSVERIHNDITDADKVIRPELAADPHRQHPSNLLRYEQIQTVIPFFMDEYASAIEGLKNTYQLQHERIQKRLNKAGGAYVIRPIDRHVWELTVAVSGNSPLEFSPWLLLPEAQAGQITISRVQAGSAVGVGANDRPELVYPGKRLVSGGNTSQEEEWINIAYGENVLVNSPLYYRYRIESKDAPALSLVNRVSVRNAVTGTSAVLALAESLPVDAESDSVHPWVLNSKRLNAVPVLELSGDIDVFDDLIFPEGQTVRILPGTTFSLAEAASLVFYGRVIAEGTADRPIRFLQKEPGEYWGSVIIKGPDASGSRLRHIELSGGSVSTQRLVDYPGEFNLHGVEGFELSHCKISDNQGGDDALHVAYSSGRISHCHFENTAFDALDMDLVSVEVSNTSFSAIGNDAIDVMSSRVTISNITVKRAGDKCLSIGENSNVDISYSSLDDCLIGLAIKDESRAALNQVSFSNNREIAIALYRKNPRYSSGGTISGRGLSGISEKDIRLSDDSTSTISAGAFVSAAN